MSEPFERTEIWHGREEVIKRGIEELSKTQRGYDFCVDAKGPLIISNNEFMKDAYLEIKNRGGKVRLIADITKDNVSCCRELLKLLELRHFDGIRGNFGVVDGKSYGAIANTQEGQVPEEYIHSTMKSFVEQQQYFFDMLWEKAIPARQRIREIEGVKREFIDTIRDPAEIQNLIFNLLKSSRDEILIIFSSSNAFHRLNHEGLLDILREMSSTYDVKTRILVEMDNEIKEFVEKLQEEEEHKAQINIHHIYKPLQIKITTLITDTSFSLTIEMKDDAKGSLFREAVGLSSYSNSESTISSYRSIFESLWIQSELEEQKRGY